MTKTKKIIIACISVFLAIALALSAFFIIRAVTKPRFDLKDNLPDGNGKKATVILLGGQSNAAGCSREEYLQKNNSAEKYAEYVSGYDNVYINFLSSGLNLSNAYVKCATKQGDTPEFFGPEVGMAEKLNELYPNELFFIIKCAWSGTNLYEQWLSPSSEGETGKLYKEFVAFVKSSMEYLIEKDYDVKIQAMCWMQGESDSFSVEHATAYELHLNNFIEDLRKDFSCYAPKNGIAFIDAFIADNPIFWVYCDEVNASKQAVANASPLNVVIDTNAHGLTCANEPNPNPDLAHYDALSEIKLGHLFIDEFKHFYA